MLRGFGVLGVLVVDINAVVAVQIGDARAFTQAFNHGMVTADTGVF